MYSIYNEEALRPYIREAQDPNAPIKTLKFLSTDRSWLVRSSVAQNRNTPSEILQVLATDTCNVVRYHVGRNPNSTELVKRLVLMTNQKYLSETT
jgi:hypothetical protein